LRDLVHRWRQQEDEINTPVPGLTLEECDARIDRLSDGHCELADAIADTAAPTIDGVVLSRAGSHQIFPVLKVDRPAIALPRFLILTRSGHGRDRDRSRRLIR
jgi:hypothetical protein